MSDTDSFIEEVTEEVRRDKLYGYLRRYGWIGALLVVLVVGGAAWSEWRKAQAEARAEALGDGILAALTRNNPDARKAAISGLSAETPRAQAVLDMIAATEIAASGDATEAAKRLNAVAENGDVPEVYRHIAGFKAMLIQAESLDIEARRQGFSNFAAPGNPMRTLAEEQLALIAVEAGDTGAAIAQLQSILNDAEASTDLQQRAMQVIVALGGEPEGVEPAQADN